PAVGAGIGNGEPHQWRPGSTRATGGQDRQSVPLPQATVLVDRIQAYRPDWLTPLEREYPDNVLTCVVLVNVRLGEDRLLLDEDGVSDAVMHRTQLLIARLDAHNARRPVVADVDGPARDRQRMYCAHDDLRAVVSGRTFCRLLIAEHAWHLAHPAETMLASIPRKAMYEATRR